MYIDVNEQTIWNDTQKFNLKRLLLADSHLHASM